MPHVAPPPAPRGRLAPSPTGRLHLGNLGTFLLAEAFARRDGGALLLRIEDLDAPRTRPGAESRILDDLEWLGIDWDVGPLPARYIRQSERAQRYEEVLRVLESAGRVYPCRCSRADLRLAASAPHGGEPVYPGTCRPPAAAFDCRRPEDAALRLHVTGRAHGVDLIHGPWGADLATEHGDFVIQRRDGLFAYHLAVVVDDHDAGVTQIVRGHDLLGATARQQAIRAILGWPEPTTAHVPLLLDARGERLSKRDRAADVEHLRYIGYTPDTVRGALAAIYGLLPGSVDGIPPLDATAFRTLVTPAALALRAICVPDALFDGPIALADALRHRRDTEGTTKRKNHVTSP